MKAKLILTSKDQQTTQDVPFDRPSITIGRKPSNDLAFNRPEISGSHAAFLFENSQYFVMDLGSTNGTLLNGAQLVAKEKYGLQDKDVITVAPYTIRFILEEDEAQERIVKQAAPPANKAPAPPPQKVESPPPPPPPPPPSAPPAVAVAPEVPVPAPSVPRNVATPEPRKAPSAVTDYLWLGIGAILVLAAIGLIIFILVGL